MSDDSEDVVLVKVPLLQEQICNGAGKLGRGVPVRQTTGVETGKCLLDLQIVHVLAGEEEARLCDGFLPGAGDAFRRAHGDGTDGTRRTSWQPENPNYRISLTHGDDPETLQPLYDGVVSVKKAELRLNAKHAVLTLFCRLGAVEPDIIPEFARNFSQPVQYTLTVVTLQGATKPADGPLLSLIGGQGSQQPPETSGSEIRPGSIAVCWSGDNEPDVVGRVVSVAGGRVILHRWLDGGEPFEAKVEDVISTTVLAGPQGGDPGDAIEKMLNDAEAQSVVVEPGHLLQALLIDGNADANGSWRITTEIRQKAIEIAISDTAPESADA